MDRPALGIALLSALLALPTEATFIEFERLPPLHSETEERAGSAVAIAGDVAVVCAEGHDVPGVPKIEDVGECVLYRLSNRSWEMTGVLQPSVVQKRSLFGHSVAISGDRIVVGAPLAPGPFLDEHPGRAYVFHRVGVDAWVEEAVLAPDAAGNFGDFGAAVAIDGDGIAVGDPLDPERTARAGAVYVFRRDGSAWALEDKVLPAGPSVPSPYFMGQAVALEGDVLIAVSAFDFHVFQGGNGQWHEKQVEPPPSWTSFANALALQGTLLAVGAVGGPGLALLYEKNGRDWEFIQTLAPPVPGGSGSTVAFAGSVLITGAPQGAMPDGSRPGAAYVFRETAGVWTQTEALLGSLSADGDAFGGSVATDGTHILLGAPLADEGVTLTTGEAYVFAVDTGNALPAANAGMDRTVECTGPAGATVTLDGSASSDADSTPGTNDALVSFEWREGAAPLGTGEVLEVVLPLGSHAITLRVMDDHGQTHEDTVIVGIVDTLPPAMTVTLAPVLWPPNHRLVDVTAALQVTGVCGPSVVTLESVTSDEPDDAPGSADGKTTGDVQEAATGTDDRVFHLRAERSSAGGGRTYTATYRVEETGVGSATASATVFVPHSQDGTADPIVLTLSKAAGGTRVDWTPGPENPVYNVIQGHLQDIVATDEAYALGIVQCIESASVDRTTAGFEHAELPLPGEAFFYAVEYDDVSYGAESAAKPRIVFAGDCF
ncbi:MAG TPA: hypothetical protein VFV75_12345 [Candidatus Polarisedimenticolaceae bacterium]|nr:hypothetical protein [Candidatus Polarisedimenticolaceae bacterium]